jgi:hypothetical protein
MDRSLVALFCSEWNADKTCVDKVHIDRAVARLFRGPICAGRVCVRLDLVMRIPVTKY